MKITIDTANLEKIDAVHGISVAEQEVYASRLTKILTAVQARGQGFATCLDDSSVQQQIGEYAESVKGKYEDIVLLGIGGSALGPIVLRDALASSNETPRLHVLENIDPSVLAQTLEALDLERTLVLVITKSGGTPETLAEYFFFRSEFEKAKLEIKDHFVFVTDSEKGQLREIANRDGIISFPIPENVGGRFSVLTSVGLLPAILMGIDVQAFLQGACTMRDSFLSPDFQTNVPYQLATIQHQLYQKGKTQNVLMPYSTRLRSFANWFTQLLAESTGKKDSTGKNVGLTPLPALGVTDQHSLLQLLAEGPNDKLTIFIRVKDFGTDLKIPALESTPKTEFLKGKSFTELLHAELAGTSESLTESDRPNITIRISSLTPEVLGGLFFLFEGATAFLGEFLGIDAFNQPGVERSKILTREKLK